MGQKVELLVIGSWWRLMHSVHTPDYQNVNYQLQGSINCTVDLVLHIKYVHHIITDPIN